MYWNISKEIQIEINQHLNRIHLNHLYFHRIKINRTNIIHKHSNYSRPFFRLATILVTILFSPSQLQISSHNYNLPSLPLPHSPFFPCFSGLCAILSLFLSAFIPRRARGRKAIPSVLGLSIPPDETSIPR